VISTTLSDAEAVRVRLVSEGPRIIEWRLLVGTSTGASDVADSGLRSGEDVFDAPLPSREGSFFARLWYRRGVVWFSEDFLLSP
jgi:hypothetical protein